MSTKIILDTDMGDDIDDAYALALILASEELQLLGVTTVFGNTPARTQQALTLLQIAGRPDIPVATGTPGILSPKRYYKFTPKSDYLNAKLPCQHSSSLPWAELPVPSSLDAPRFLIEKILSGNGDITIVTVGALTNLALAMALEPKICAKIPRIVCMGGVFDQQVAEYNINCDPIAAALVFESEVPITVVGLDVTLKCQFTDEDLARLNNSERPLARNLAKATSAWVGTYPVLHDPLAVETLIQDDLVTMRNGIVRVSWSDETAYGCTIFESASETPGLHDVGFAVKHREAIDLWLDRVLNF